MIDVRPRAQFDIVHLENSINVPYEDLIQMREEELKNKFKGFKEMRVSCKGGVMSRLATDFLLKNGFEEAQNVVGGINAYAKTFDAQIADV